MNEENSKHPNVFRSSAEDGLVIGAYISATFLVGAYGMRVPVLSIISLLMCLGVVFIAYRLMARDYRRWKSLRYFSAVWMHGIGAFFFGSLILSCTAFIYLRFIEPTFIVDNVNAAIAIYREFGTTEAVHMADTLQKMIDKHMLPSPISMASTLIWFVTFAGSMLSLLLTAIIRASIKPQD